MKSLHTADWHLGNNFHGHERTTEHRHFIQWLLDVLGEELPDVMIIAGDIFDNANPSATAEGLFYDFLLDATERVPGLQIVVVAGNHDSAGRLDAPAELLKRHNIYVRGAIRWNESTKTPDFDQLILPLSSRLTPEAEVVCLAVPYLRPYDYPAGMTAAEGLHYYFENLMQRVGKSIFKDLPIIAAAHFYAAGAEVCENEHSERLVVGGQDCVPADVIGKGIAYTALGHIHRSQKVKNSVTEMYFSGSALPMSFTERGYQHGVQIVELKENGQVTVNRDIYSPLRRLLCIPHQGAATKEEMFDTISQLPKREKGDNGDSWPYLEIHLLEKQPEPSLLHDVTEALSDRAVHFCRIIRELPPEEHEERQLSHKETLQSISPLEMARRVFTNYYQDELPEALESRFKKAEEICMHHPSNS